MTTKPATPAGPKPVVVRTVCSECGLDWDGHGERPTFADCIRLLKAELAKRPAYATVQTFPNTTSSSSFTVMPAMPNTGWGFAGGSGNPNPPNVSGGDAGALVPRVPRPKRPSGAASA